MEQQAQAAETLTQLRNALLRLHKELLDSERAIYERDIAKIDTPGQFLNLLLGDPWFAYLRELSGLIAEIDQKLDDKKEPADLADTHLFLQRAKRLLVPAEFGNGF
jgi:hypothetical protein